MLAQPNPYLGRIREAEVDAAKLETLKTQFFNMLTAYFQVRDSLEFSDNGMEDFGRTVNDAWDDGPAIVLANAKEELGE